MHRLMPGVTILEHELSELRLLVERQAGILLDCPNSALAAHVGEYLEHQELNPRARCWSVSAFRSGSLPVAGVSGRHLNVNSGFFRHPGATNALARLVVPQKINSRKPDEAPGTLRVWSAGCGTGKRAYRLPWRFVMRWAMARAARARTEAARTTKTGIPKKRLPPAGTAESPRAARRGWLLGAKDWSVHIVGSDLLASAIEVAERGLYPQSALTGLPPATIRAFFSRIGTASGGSNGAPEVGLKPRLLKIIPRMDRRCRRGMD